MPHVDHLAGTLDSLESRLQHGFGAAHEGHDSPVGRLARIHVEHLDALLVAVDRHLGRSDGLNDLINNIFVSPFTEIGHAFYNLCHSGYVFLICGYKFMNNLPIFIAKPKGIFRFSFKYEQKMRFSWSLSLSKRPMSPPGSFERLPLGYNCRVIPPSASGCRTRSGRNGGAR